MNARTEQLYYQKVIKNVSKSNTKSMNNLCRIHARKNNAKMIETNYQNGAQGNQHNKQIWNNPFRKRMLNSDAVKNEGISQPWLTQGSTFGDARGGGEPARAGFGDFRLMPSSSITLATPMGCGG